MSNPVPRKPDISDAYQLQPARSNGGLQSIKLPPRSIGYGSWILVALIPLPMGLPTSLKIAGVGLAPGIFKKYDISQNQ